jgi:hypothetical protein
MYVSETRNTTWFCKLGEKNMKIPNNSETLGVHEKLRSFESESVQKCTKKKKNVDASLGPHQRSETSFTARLTGSF